MVSGRRQAMDSAFIKASASMESLLEKEVLEDSERYADELAENSDQSVKQDVTKEKNQQIEDDHQQNPVFRKKPLP
jgi:hypothetical protein